MAVTLQIVDKIDASPSVRLDLNDGTTWTVLADGTNFGFPTINYAVASGGVLRDGDELPASAYGNRTLTLALRLSAASQDAAGTQLQTLHRELNRERNILKYQPHGATNPVFFRTFRVAPSSEPPYPGMLDGRHNYQVTVEIPAEPFAYGLKQTPVNAVIINNDPAAATNPQFIDVTGVLGEVETPLHIKLDSATSALMILGIRSRGTPADISRYQQAEDATAGTDTANPGGGPDAAMSGSGTNNFLRTTFVTTTMATRVTSTPLGITSNVDIRGHYRLFARVRKSVAGDTIKLRFQYEDFTSKTVTLPSEAGPMLVDLGVVRVPAHQDPETDGYSNSAVAVRHPTVNFQAERTAGSGNLDWDYFVAVPADTAFLIVDWQTTLFTGVVARTGIIDGPRDTVYNLNSSDAVHPTASLPRSGRIPLLVPNQTNRLIILKPQSSSVDTKGDSFSSFTVSYWPRYLHIRPA